MEHKSETFGFDAQSEEYVDLVDSGIVDPAKVVRAALQDAASVAGLLVTTEAMVAEAPKKQTPPPPMPGGGGMGGMDLQGPSATQRQTTKGAVRAAPFSFDGALRKNGTVRSWPARRRGADLPRGDNERRSRTSWRLSNPSRKGLISRAACPLATLPMAAWWAGMWATTPCFSPPVATNCSRLGRRARTLAAGSPED